MNRPPYRTCGVCGGTDIPQGVDWKFWIQGMPAHEMCALRIVVEREMQKPLRTNPATGVPLGWLRPHITKLAGNWIFVAEFTKADIGQLRRFVRELRANDIPAGHTSTEYGDT